MKMWWYITKQSHCVGQLDGGNDNDVEAPVPDAGKDELHSVGDEDEVPLVS